MASTKRKRTGGSGSAGSSGASKGTGGSAGGSSTRPKLKSSHEAFSGGRPAPKSSGPRPAKGKGGPARPLPPVVRTQSSRPRRTKAATPPSRATSAASDKARDLAIAVAIGALEKKAVGLEILDVAGRVDYADFLVIMTGRSDRQVQALAQGIEETLRKKGVRPLAVEGLPHASWVLMDFGDVVVHVFQDEARHLYDIEGLWMDARRVPVPVPDEMR